MPNLPTRNKSNKCYYCGTPLNKSNRTIDHMYPISRGGANRQYNRVWCCRECNAAKMDMTVVEFNRYKELKKLYKGQELIEKCRDEGILLWTNERRVRNKMEKESRRRKKEQENGDKKLS